MVKNKEIGPARRPTSWWLRMLRRRAVPGAPRERVAGAAL